MLGVGRYVVQEQLDDALPVDRLERLPRRGPAQRPQRPVDHRLVGLADPRVRDPVDGRALGEVGAELAVHVLDARLLVRHVRVGVEHPRPDLPARVGLDGGVVGEAGVVVGEYEREDPAEGLPAEPRVEPVPEGPHGRGVALRQQPDVDEAELRYGDGQDRLPVGDLGPEEVHLAAEGPRVAPPVGEVVQVLAALLTLRRAPVVVGPRPPLLVPRGHGEVDPLRGHESQGDPAVDRLLGGYAGDAGLPRYLIDRPLRGEPRGERVVNGPELLLGAVEPLPALHEPRVGHRLRGPGVVPHLGAPAPRPAVLPRAAVADVGEAGEPPALAGPVGRGDPVPPDLPGDGGGVHAEPLGDRFQRLPVGEPMGDLDPLLEREVLPLCYHNVVLSVSLAGNERILLQKGPFDAYYRTNCSSAAENGLNFKNWHSCAFIALFCGKAE